MREALRHRLGAVLVVLAVAAFGAVLFRSAVRGVGGSDAAGYANTARDISAGRIVLPVAGPAELGLDPKWAPVFTPLAHEPGPRPGTMVPFYPPGFPLHLAAAAAIGGWNAAPFFVSPIAALLCIGLTYVLGRELGLSKTLALCGAVVLGAWNIFLLHAIQPMSDVAAALWASASVVAALRARRRSGWALAAGAAFGMAVLVRPTNAILVLALAFALPWRMAELGLFVAGGLPAAAFYAAWNRAAFGNPLRSGYTHVLGEFAFANFVARFVRYWSQVAVELSPLVPIGALAVAADRRVGPRDRAVLVAWFGSIFLVYCFWGPSDNWTYARYLLPAAPAAVVSFLIVLRDVAARLRTSSRRTAAVAAALAVVFVCELLADRRWRPLRAAPGETVYPLACRALTEGSDGRPTLGVSMVFSAALRYYTNVVPVRWDYLNPETFAILRKRAAERGWRVTAVLFPFEVPQAVARVPGPWVFLGNVRQAGLWELPPGP